MSKGIIVLAILVGLAFITAGVIKLTSPQEMVNNFHRFDYTTWFLHFITGAEIAGGIGLMVPKLRGWAATGLALIMIGAVYSHATHDSIRDAIPALVLAFLCGIIASRIPAKLIK